MAGVETIYETHVQTTNHVEVKPVSLIKVRVIKQNRETCQRSSKHRIILKPKKNKVLT
jgi:hypothetical protein